MIEFIRALLSVFGGDNETEVIPIDEWPKTISGHDLIWKVERLHYEGRKSQKFSWYVAQYLRGTPKLVLRDIELPNSIGGGMLDRLVVREYADRKTPFPPILIYKLGRISDGWHRLHAARLRGERTIRAYVPSDFDCEIMFDQPAHPG